MRNDLRTAWRSIRAHPSRVTLAALLLGVALAANTVVFATADSLVFRRITFPGAERLVELQRRNPETGEPSGSSFVSPALLDIWRQQADLFTAVEGYLHKSTFITGAGEPELVPTADVTPGLIDALGERPRWGRSFVDGDDRHQDAHSVLIAESLARERFGDPAAAVGQLIPTTAVPLRVVGVMGAGFRFPDHTQRIWRALDPRGSLAAGFVGVASVARVAPAVPLGAAPAMIAQRSVGVGEAAGAPAGYMALATPLRSASSPPAQRQMLLVLLAAAACLLLLACASVASLELAGALGRTRTYAVQLALGASRVSLVRTALAEGLFIIGSAAALAAWLTSVGTAFLVDRLPPAMIGGSLNPVDPDIRAAGFMLAAAALTWLLCTLPVIAFAGRADLIETLKTEGASASASRGSVRIRSGLAVAQIALAVLLLTGTVLFVRTYAALLAIDKGFDSTGVVTISLTIPPQALGTPVERRALAEQIVERVRTRPGVIDAFEGAPPPSTGDSPSTITHLEVDDRPPFEANLLFPKLYVGAEYFRTLRIPLVAGRVFEPGEPPANVIIPETLASRLWPNEEAVGRRFRESPQRPWYHVIGVVGHVRTLHDPPSGPDRHFQLYFARQPPPPATGPSGPPPAGLMHGFVAITARVDSRARATDLYQTVRSVDPRNILRVELVDDLYARQFSDRRVATTVVTAFGVVAFLVAAAGVYGLVAFLVASRERELGIRIALGADARRIRHLVLGSALRLAAGGAVVGVAAALVASRWVEAQLYQVEARDPLTLATVVALIGAVSLLAASRPAYAATRIDPKLLLKN